MTSKSESLLSQQFKLIFKMILILLFKPHAKTWGKLSTSHGSG